MGRLHESGGADTKFLMDSDLFTENGGLEKFPLTFSLWFDEFQNYRTLMKKLGFSQ